MAESGYHPNFKAFAALQNEPAKGSLDPNRKAQPEDGDDAGKGPTKLTISQYQDPRDQLDQERHGLFARARERAEAVGHHAAADGSKKAAKR